MSVNAAIKFDIIKTFCLTVFHIFKEVFIGSHQKKC